MGNFSRMKLSVILFIIVSVLYSLTGCSSKKSACGCPYQSGIQYKPLLSDEFNFNIFLTVNDESWQAVQVYPQKVLEKILSFNPVKEKQKFICEAVIKEAFKYQGVRYRRGGLSKKGVDCSGLVLKCFSNVGISLPRTSVAMAKSVMDVDGNEAKAGDLIFFKTNRRRNIINHVGIITAISGEEIKFIHASVKNGVIESSTFEPYYAHRYVKIGRVRGI